MNYAQYLQQGGQAPSIEEQVASLVQAAMQGDQQANDQISQIMQAAEQGDPKAQQLAQLIQQVAQKLQEAQPEAMKCGGKVRAKIKKACGGKKLEEGDKIKKAKKGCPCTLHRIGGKLVEVDCNGIPIAKNGIKIAKFQPGGNVYVGYGSNFISTDPRHSYVGDKGNFGNLGDFEYYIDRNGGNKLYAKGKDGKIYMSGNTFWDKFGGGDNFHNWSEVTGDALTDEIKGYFGNNSAYATDYTGRLYGSRELAQAASNTSQASNKTNKYNRPGGIFADTNLTDKSFAGRRNWLANQENADYLAQVGLGFDANSYKGTPEQNIALLQAINGKAAWDQQHAAAVEAERKAAHGNDMTNQQLLAYDPNAEGVQQLGEAAAARRQKLLAAQEARNKALTFNGKQYADEIAYNKAVGSANQAAANKFYADKQAADEAYAQRRAQNIGYTGSNKNIIARRNAAFDNVAKWLAGQFDPSTLTGRDKVDFQRQLQRTQSRDIYTMPQYGNAPTIISNYSGPAALTQEQLAATTFAKKGGSLNYTQYAQVGGILFPPLAPVVNPNQTNPRLNAQSVDEYGNPIQKQNDKNLIDNFKSFWGNKTDQLKKIIEDYKKTREEKNEQWKQEQYYNPNSPWFYNERVRPKAPII